MGLFDWLKGNSPKHAVNIAVDRIWMTPAAKFAGIQREIASALADPDGADAIFVVAHFADCLTTLQSLVSSAEFDESRVFVTYSRDLEVRTAIRGMDESVKVFIIVGERHPLPSHDDALLEFAARLSCQCRFVQHVSLHDPLLRVFAGAWISQLLTQLGMEEDQPVESRMVSRRVRAAQQRFADHATGDAPASSAAEWIEKNCPSVK